MISNAQLTWRYAHSPSLTPPSTKRDCIYLPSIDLPSGSWFPDFWPRTPPSGWLMWLPRPGGNPRPVGHHRHPRSQKEMAAQVAHSLRTFLPKTTQITWGLDGPRDVPPHLLHLLQLLWQAAIQVRRLLARPNA